MNTSFCERMSQCGQVCDPDEVICITDQVVKLQFDQTVAAVLYIVFRIIERVVFAVYTQTSRELLKVDKNLRKSYTHCCVRHNCKDKYFNIFSRCVCFCPTGIYLQMWLRFFGSFFGVISFFLILEQNIVMFVAVVIIDVLFENVRFRFQPKDHNIGDDFHHADLAWFLNEDHYNKLDIDEAWLENFNKLMAKYKAEDKVQTEKKKAVALKYF